ncbi:MAG: hypothetical protein SGBAC_013390 [Bacillariaceae sp.]
MVEFGKQLQKSIAKGKPEWSTYYIDYDRLKTILKVHKRSISELPAREMPSHRHSSLRSLSDFSFAIKSQSSSSSSSDGSNNNNTITGKFQHALDQEIEKVVLFLLHQQGTLAQNLSLLNAKREACHQQVQRLVKKIQMQGQVQVQGLMQRQMQSITDDSNTNAMHHVSLEDCKSVLQTLVNDYRSNARLVLDFISYVELNVTAVRKILKKHDKLPQIQRSGGSKKDHQLSQSYISKFTSQMDSHLDQLYNYGGLSALVVTLKKAFDEMHEMEIALLQVQYYKNNNNNNNNSNNKDSKLDGVGAAGPTDENNVTNPNNAAQSATTATTATTAAAAAATATTIPPKHRRVQSDSLVLGWNKTNSSTQNNKKVDNKMLRRRDSARSAARTSSSNNTNNHNHNHNNHNTDMLLASWCTLTHPSGEPILSKIRAARNRLTQSTKYVQVVAAQSLMMLEEESSLPEANADKVMTQSQQISSFLNLCSTFLYMTNYYIVAPTSGQYAQKLGSTEAMAGIIIGMTPNAALVATVLYGWWSNHSYKAALIFASSCSLVGNVFYAMALHQDSLTYVMIGRFFNGFGSARSINRRFIADTFSRADRTAASASFVVAGGLGMAVGPAIAAILGKVEYPVDSLIFSAETAPGWVMLSLWSVFFVCFVVLFEEPDRSHIYGDKSKNTTASSAPTTPTAEEQPLLMANSESSMKAPVKKDLPIYENVAVMLTLFIYFVLKFALECLLSSSATVTSYYFQWNTQNSGAFLAFLGLLNFPANMFVARLSHQYQDRELIYGTLLLMLVSVLGIFVYNPDHYTSYQYMAFAILVFLSANCLEGPNMSLLSKVIPKSWAKGIFNSGFLATEAGTAARSIGDVLISAMATWAGFENLLNATFLPLLVSVVVCIGLVRSNFDAMVEVDEDDEEEEEETNNKNDDVEKPAKIV